MYQSNCAKVLHVSAFHYYGNEYICYMYSCNNMFSLKKRELISKLLTVNMKLSFLPQTQVCKRAK